MALKPGNKYGRKRFDDILRNQRGEGYVDVVALVLCVVLVLALALRVLPVFVKKQQLDTFATELVQRIFISCANVFFLL